MKIQLIILVALVVATLAHRHSDGDEENQVGSRRQFKGRRRNDNQIAANAEDAELEDSISSEDETVTEGSEKKGEGCGRGSRRGGRRGERRGERRGSHRHDPEWHQENGVEGDNHHHHQFTHNAEWHEKHGVAMPDEDSVGRKHHRHHHHHHRNRTTSTTTTSTTSTNAPTFASNE